ncbi:MAG: hypothetical protein WCS80_01925 [Bacilli bacterium]
MNSQNYLYSDSFSEMTIKRRIYLTKESTSPERLAFLAYLLNDSQVKKNKDRVSSYLGGKIVFDAVYYGDGYLLTASLSQVITKAFSYLFVDPFKKGRELLIKALSDGFSQDKNVFSGLLNEFVMKNRKKNSSYDSIRSGLGVPLFSLSLDIKALSSLSVFDVLNTLRECQEATTGDYLYFGPAMKNDPLLGLPPFKNDLSPISFHVLNDTPISSPYFSDETVSYLISFGKVTDHNDFFMIETALESLSLALKSICDKQFHSQIETNHFLLTTDKAILALTFKTGRIPSNIMSLLKTNALISVDPTPYVDDAIKIMNVRKIEVFSDYDDAFSLAHRGYSLGLKLSYDILDYEVPKKEKIQAAFKSMTVLQSYTAKKGGDER